MGGDHFLPNLIYKTVLIVVILGSFAGLFAGAERVIKLLTGEGVIAELEEQNREITERVDELERSVENSQAIVRELAEQNRRITDAITGAEATAGHIEGELGGASGELEELEQLINNLFGGNR